MRLGRQADRVGRALGLGRVHPLHELPHPVGDLLGRRDLVEVEPMQRHVLAVRRLSLALELFGSELGVDLLDHVQRDREALLLAVLPDDLDRREMITDLVVDRRQAALFGRLVADGGHQLFLCVDDAFQRAVVIDPRHPQAGLEVFEHLGRGGLSELLIMRDASLHARTLKLLDQTAFPPLGPLSLVSRGSGRGVYQPRVR